MVLVEEECCDTPAAGVVEPVLAVGVVAVVVVAAAAVVGQSCFHCCCGEAPALDPGNAMGIEEIDVVADVAPVVAEISLVRETGLEVEVKGVQSPDEQQRKGP